MTPVLAFLGCGSMNGSILRGVLASGVPVEQVRATVRSAESARRLQEETGVRAYVTGEDPEANRRAAAEADVVLLGVKPVGIVELAREIAPAVRPGTVVASVAAGISVGALERALPEGQPVVRTMPNTPSSVRRGVVSVTPGSATAPEQTAAVRRVLEAVGTVVEVPEEQVDAVTGVSGSGPAYVFLLAEALQQAGERMGLPAETARVLARETVSGAGELLRPAEADPAALRRAVTSPKGTTDRAIRTFQDNGFEELVARAARASAERSAELTRELSGE
ncbi:pyrroline-5-carboxylate reductase [Kocuria flava]|uniref:pyrroline-5-carboxylate reductase n=1 Tax=Kocuria flava TaxID=446860 RepID=UPI001FF31983|nr:pyrroline-5-carboxylate reductase [Kocuria flava]MCJ8503592.1 pyrroline-5-carboxylate reductase [Kocuria flava]